MILPMPQTAVIMYSIHADRLPLPRMRSVKITNGHVNGFILQAYHKER